MESHPGEPGTEVGDRKIGSRRKMGAIVAAVIVVAAGLGAFIYFETPDHDLGVTSGPGGSVTASSFSTAYSEANGSVQGVGGGPWLLFEAEAIDTPAPLTIPTSGAPTGCSAGGPSTVPAATPTDVRSGLSPSWSFGYVSAVSDSTVEVTVIGTAVSVLGPMSSPGPCTLPYRPGTLLPIAQITDTPTLVSDLPNLSAFDAQFPTATVFLLLSDVGGGVGRVSNLALWTVLATPCLNTSSAFLTNVAPGDPEYAGGVNSSRPGAVFDEGVDGLGHCSAPGDLGADLTLGPARTVYTPTGIGLDQAVEAVRGSLTTSMFHPEVFPTVTAEGVPPVSPASEFQLELLNASGSVVAAYNFTTSSWTSGAGLAVTSGETLQLEYPGTVFDQALVLVADPPLTGDLGVRF